MRSTCAPTCRDQLDDLATLGAVHELAARVAWATDRRGEARRSIADAIAVYARGGSAFDDRKRAAEAWLAAHR